jgi:uncharacterized protein
MMARVQGGLSGLKWSSAPDRKAVRLLTSSAGNAVCACGAVVAEQRERADFTRARTSTGGRDEAVPLTKYEKVKDILCGMDRVVVAFSGGVDSTLLLKAALDALGPDRVLAVTADSETYPTREMEEAVKIAGQLGARHRVIRTSELDIPGYKENTPSRCYFCKQNLFQHLQEFIRKEGYTHIVYGLIMDDMGEHRPGYKAAVEQGVRGPLQEAGLYKQEIRELSRMMGLPTWDKPSFACLSSRIAYGEMITQEKLTRVERAESFIMSLGIRQVRVRTHDNIARIEVEPDDMPKLLSRREEVANALASYGYTFVTMDLGGYKSGNLNKMLADRNGVRV